MSITGMRQFDQTVQETNAWLNDIAEELGHPDRQIAYHALRGVLFTLRDRLPLSENFGLANQLPTLIRGIYFEGYRPAGKPEKYNRDDFLHHVAKELDAAGGADPEQATRAVLSVLARHVSQGEAGRIQRVLPKGLQDLWPEAA